MSTESDIQKLLNRALPANDNNTESTIKTPSHEKLYNSGVNVIGNHNIIIDANLLVFTSCMILMAIINLLTH